VVQGVVGLSVDCFAIFSDGFGCLAAFKVLVGQRNGGFSGLRCVVRFLLLLISFHLLSSPIRLAETAKGFGEFEVGFGEGDLQLDGFLKVLYGLFPLMKLNLNNAKVVVGVVVFRIEPDSFFEMDSRLFGIAVFSLDDSAEIENFGVVRPGGEKFGSHGTGFLVLAEQDENSEEFDLFVYIARVRVGCAGDELDGVGVAMHPDENDRHGFGEIDGVGMELKALSEDAFGVVEITELAEGAGEIDGEAFGAGSVAQEHDGFWIVLAGKKGGTQSFKSGLRGVVDGERELPLFFSRRMFALFLVYRGEEKVGLDHTGLETSGLFEFRLGISRAPESEKGEALKIVELGGSGISLEAGTEGLDGAIELLVAGIPAAEDYGVIGSWVSFQIGDKRSGSVTSGVSRQTQDYQARQCERGESRSGPEEE